MIEVNGIKGFINKILARLSYGSIPIYKTYVFPFENYYVAAVYNLGNFDPDEVDRSIQEFQAGEYPADRRVPLEMMDFLANSLRFEPIPCQHTKTLTLSVISQSLVWDADER